MDWVILKSPFGERKVEAGKPFRFLPGEIIIGTQVDEAVSYHHVQDKTRILLDDIEKELQIEGNGLGDWVKTFASPVAALLGKSKCQSCDVRKVVLNSLQKLTDKHGAREAKRIIKDLIWRSFKEDNEVILKELKEYLT